VRYIISIILVSVGTLLSGQKKPAIKTTKILFVFDASRSMSGTFNGKTRMQGAKELFNKFIDTLSRNKTYQFALRMYGHTVKYPPGDCRDSKLVVPFGPGNIETIRLKVNQAKPTGITPIEHSLTEAANDFKDTRSNNIVIIITDGIEECGGDPCRARHKLVEKGIVFRPFIIGIGLTPKQIKTFECVGDFYDAADSTAISHISGIIRQQIPLRTTVQVNLLDITGKPSETNVNTTFYDAERQAYKYNYIHTLNYRQNPDTMVVDAAPAYKVVAHTIPPMESAVTRLSPGKHNIIAIDAPQGFLNIRRQEGAYNNNEKIKCIVRKKEEMNTLNVQQLNTTEKYITGGYDLEVLTLPRTYLSDQVIAQSKTTVLDIPSAGSLQLKCLEAGDGSILVKRGDRLEWVCNLTGQTVQTYNLQPGNYVAAWRAKSLKGSIYTIEKKFTITSDNQTVIEFYR
jgi:Ca-activated chloride channel family protein